jgi:hypothetical protein
MPSQRYGFYTLILPMPASCPTLHILLDLIPLIIDILYKTRMLMDYTHRPVLFLI